MRKICKHTKMSWSSWSARVALQLSGRYEPYRLICRWLNVKRPGRCAPWGAQGVDTAYGNSYKGQTIRRQAGSLSAFFQAKRTQNICMLSYEKTGSRYEIRDTRRMRKIFIKDIFNILLLSLIQTYKYEPYRLICRWLNVKRLVGVLLGEHRGWMLHMAFSYKAKAFRTTAFFPLFQHTAFYFPPSDESDGFETIFCLECLQT